MAISKVASAVVVKRLYRSLLRAAKPYTSPSPNAAVLSCLLYRTGIDDWDSVAKATPQEYARTEDRARDLTESYATRRAGGNSQGENSRESYAAIQHQRLFRSLLREVVAGSNGYRRMLFPSQVDPTRLRDVVRREFRENNDIPTISAPFDDTTRIQVAFVALRELNKKLSHFEFLEQESGTPIPQQAARHVSPLPFTPSSSYLKPGVFLVSHPHLNDSFFSKSVVCILDHKDESTESGSKRSEDAGSTYGVIVNRFSMNPETGKNRTIREAFLKSRLPARLADIFGDAVVKDGGPVHVSIQMLYAAAADNEELSSIGGAVIPMVPEGDSSTALFSDQATYFQGDLFQAMTAVENGKIDRGTSRLTWKKRCQG